MYNYKTKNLPKNSLEMLVTIPLLDIKAEYELAFDRLQKELTVEGFRKGKVPKDIAKKHLKDDAIYENLIRSLLPKIYDEIVKKEGIKPIVSPKIELVKATPNEDWQIKIVVALKPIVDLNNFKDIIKKAKEQHKKVDIWVPGKSEKQEDKAKQEAESQQKLLNEILEALLKGVKVEVSDLILEEEVNRRLSQLVDDIRKIGLTTDAYLKSKNLTMDEVKKRYAQEIEDTYRVEFLLNEIADHEGIKVEKEDLDKLFGAITDEKEKKMAHENAYFYASILRKQKTLDYLMSL